jgi:hypothetical protein
MRRGRIGELVRLCRLAFLMVTFVMSAVASPSEPDDLLLLTVRRVSKSVQELASIKCTEQVVQEKLVGEKVQFEQDSTYDYLVILTNTESDLRLEESRLLMHEDNKDPKKNMSLLVSNGFATLFLIFHPFYSGSFQFSRLPDEVVEGRRLSRFQFQHIRGMRTPAALALRGREFPLELSGAAWVEPGTGTIVRISADVGSTLEDVGLKTLRSEIRYAPIPLSGLDTDYWFPVEARVEVETPRQHWRNIHRFTDYKRFDVTTVEDDKEKK